MRHLIGVPIGPILLFGTIMLDIFMFVFFTMKIRAIDLMQRRLIGLLISNGWSLHPPIRHDDPEDPLIS